MHPKQWETKRTENKTLHEQGGEEEKHESQNRKEDYREQKNKLIKIALERENIGIQQKAIAWEIQVCDERINRKAS